MASIQQDPSGNFHIAFRFGGKRYKRSLKTAIERKALATANHVEENIRLIEAGRMDLPDDVDVPTYLMSDGKLAKKPKVKATLQLKDLLSQYLDATPEGSQEPTTLKTTRIHMRHFGRVLGDATNLRSIGTADLQRYVTCRSREAGQRGKNVSAATIRKELSTFGSLWNWAENHGFVSGAFPRKGVVFPKHDEKPPFQTWQQIQRQIERDGLTDEQAAPLWDCLYLNAKEVGRLLKFVKLHSNYSFLYPMCVLAAYTGARRSELCRVRTSDVDLQAGTITIRERKRSRAKRTTRTIPLAASVRTVLKEWTANKYSSPFLFPEDHRCIRIRKDQHEEGTVTPDEASHHLASTLARGRWLVIRGWHVFRHSFISNCASKGVDQRFIDPWVGHQTDEQRRRYRHLFPDSQAKVINSVFS